MSKMRKGETERQAQIKFKKQTQKDYLYKGLNIGVKEDSM